MYVTCLHTRKKINTFKFKKNFFNCNRLYTDFFDYKDY